jgi:hypothetical protein
MRVKLVTFCVTRGSRKAQGEPSNFTIFKAPKDVNKPKYLSHFSNNYYECSDLQIFPCGGRD